MSEEKKTVELKDEQLEQVTGGKEECFAEGQFGEGKSQVNETTIVTVVFKETDASVASDSK